MKQMGRYILVTLIFLAVSLAVYGDDESFKGISFDETEWMLNRGFNYTWVRKDFDPSTEGDWIKTSKVPVDISRYYPDVRGVAEFTLVTVFNYEGTVPGSVSYLGLLLPAIGQSWQAYLNGYKIKDEMFLNEDGTIKVYRSIRDSLAGFPISYLNRGKNTLALRIKGDPRFWKTGLSFTSNYRIDAYPVLDKVKSERFIFMLISLYLVVAGYHLILFVKRRETKYNLYFGLFGLGVFIYFLVGTSSIFEIFPDSSVIWRVELMVLFSLVPLLFAFMESLFFDEVLKFTKIYAVFCAVLAVAIPVFPLFITEIVLRIWQISAFPVLGYGIYIIIKALRAKVREVVPLIAGILVIFSTATFDILDTLMFHTGITLTKYGFFIFIMGIAMILADRFIFVFEEAEELNVNLEGKVRERTDELSKTLEEVSALKEQQDGDYYLTSLLMKPLGRNETRDGAVLIEEVTRQKKHFTFRNKDFEIGGDLNIATRIKLHERDYSAFINCDAMGKSIQGAGGALIAGVIYNLFLNRTRRTKNYSNRFPERWLKECFYDMQHVFSSFDGAMLASMTIGLVDEGNGFMYYINAGHPWLVLFREGKARFLETSQQVHKVGMEMDESDLTISTYQMYPGDTVIMGTDGKDEILLGLDSGGARNINDNEELFVNYVQRGEGNIYRILNLITEEGELTDDVALLSITYRPEGFPDELSFVSLEELPDDIKKALDEARTSFQKGDKIEALGLLRTAKERTGNNAAVLNEIVRLYILDGNNSIAADVAEQYSVIAPGDTDLLYLASYALKKTALEKDNEYEAVIVLQKAADYGERCRLRRPRLSKNLFNLADIYRLLEDNTKARRLLDAGLEIRPDDKNALALREML